jgi:hypothetical protein
MKRGGFSAPFFWLPVKYFLAVLWSILGGLVFIWQPGGKVKMEEASNCSQKSGVRWQSGQTSIDHRFIWSEP